MIGSMSYTNNDRNEDPDADNDNNRRSHCSKAPPTWDDNKGVDGNQLANVQSSWWSSSKRFRYPHQREHGNSGFAENFESTCGLEIFSW